MSAWHHFIGQIAWRHRHWHPVRSSTCTFRLTRSNKLLITNISWCSWAVPFGFPIRTQPVQTTEMYSHSYRNSIQGNHSFSPFNRLDGSHEAIQHRGGVYIALMRKYYTRIVAQKSRHLETVTRVALCLTRHHTHIRSTDSRHVGNKTLHQSMN